MEMKDIPGGKKNWIEWAEQNRMLKRSDKEAHETRESQYLGADGGRGRYRLIVATKKTTLFQISQEKNRILDTRIS